MNTLTNEKINKEYKEKMYVQDYSKKPQIEGVQIKIINNMVGEDGDFAEIIRLDAKGELELFPGFKLSQVNKTRLFPNAVKAWHLHFKQEDIWYTMPHSHLLVGLWDLREDSPTKDMTMRIPMGGGKAQLLYIPRGVAHGMVNVSGEPADLVYFMNNTFTISDPDERRLPWDSKGADFWNPQRD